MEYGCEIWAGDISNAMERRLQAVQDQAAREILSCGSRAPGVFARGELGWQSVAMRTADLRMRYWARLSQANPKRLLARVAEFRYSQVVEGKAPRSWFVPTLKLAAKLGLENASPSDVDWQEKLEEALAAVEEKSWSDEVERRSSLDLYRTLKQKPKAEEFLKHSSNWKGRVTKIRMRGNTYHCVDRVGAWLGWPAGARTCPMCDEGDVEDVAHLMLWCSAYARPRQELLKVLNSRLVEVGEPEAARLVQQGTQSERLVILLGGDPDGLESALSMRAKRRVDRAVCKFLEQLEKVRSKVMAGWTAARGMTAM